MTNEERFEQNQNLVYYVYRNHMNLHYPSWEQDIIQEGFLYLWKACIRFDDSLGLSFSTFAVTCIYNGMILYVKRKVSKYVEPISLEYSIGEDDEDGQEKFSEDYYLSDSTEQNSFEIDNLLNSVFTHCDEKVVEVAKNIIAGYKQEQVAQMCNINQCAVSRYWKKFKSKFKEVYLSAIN